MAVLSVPFGPKPGTIMVRRLGPMLKVVDGAGKPELESASSASEARQETPVRHADEATMRDLLRSVAPPRLDPLADLAARAAHGDETAMGDLLRSIAPSLLAAVRAVAGRNAPDVEDIAQEALVALVQALPAFRSECSVTHYASRIAVRTAMAARKRRVARENHADALGEETVADEMYAASPGDEAWASRRRAALRTVMGELPEIQAETFALRIALGYSMQEVADATGAPVNTVRSRLRLAKEALRRRIEEDPALIEVLGEES
jgi:RNA polymerase sigma factor (sigma-70 family)